MEKRVETGKLLSNSEFESGVGFFISSTEFWLQKERKQVTIKELLEPFEGKQIKITIEEIPSSQSSPGTRKSEEL